MNADQHWQMRRRQLEDRQHQFVQSLDDMGPDEMRWLVRYLADALTEQRWQSLLAGYHESLSSERMHQFLERFIPECIQLAILDLDAKREENPESLHSLTDTDLQAMSIMEKWQLVAREPRVLDPPRAARELARLALCLQTDLLHDAMLPRAVIEFPFYFQLQEALKSLPADEIYRLSDSAAASVPATDRLPAAEAADRLAALRQEITRAAGFTAPVQDLLGGSMDRLPKELFPPAIHEEPPADHLAEAERQLEDLSLEELRRNLQILADQMSLREFQELTNPLRSRYPSLGEIPPEELRRLVATLSISLGGRGLCDFIQRYRTGKFLAGPPLNSEVWSLLPQEEQLRLLEQDNAAMDLAQLARHLAKLLLTGEYQMLDDHQAQTAIVTSPAYHDAVERLIRLGDREGVPGILTLHQAVTKQALAMERAPRESRGGALIQIRGLIEKALGPSRTDRSDKGNARGR